MASFWVLLIFGLSFFLCTSLKKGNGRKGKVVYLESHMTTMIRSDQIRYVDRSSHLPPFLGSFDLTFSPSPSPAGSYIVVYTSKSK